jgi:hypothetical protein
LSNSYTVAPVSGATLYVWSLPGGWTGSSTTNTISVIPSFSSGVVTVAYSSTCGTSPASTLLVNASSAPSNPGPLYGNAVACIGTSNIYAVAPVIGATSYSWNFPNGWTGVSSASSNSTSVIPYINSGIVTVVAVNLCGSVTSTLNVSVKECGNLTGFLALNKDKVSEIVVYPNPNSGNFSIYHQNAGTGLFVSISDFVGKEVYSNKLPLSDKNDINIEVKQGLYFLRLSDENGNVISIKKFVVK